MIKFFVVVSLLTEVAQAQSYEEKSIIRAATEIGVPAPLLRAICYSESRLQRTAYAHGDGGKLGSAFGMCQILYGTATTMGVTDERCKESFVDKPKDYKVCKLFGPYTNAKIAARLLKRLLRRYDNNYVNAVAAYNSGIPKTCPRRGYFHIQVFDKKNNKMKKRRRKCVAGGLLNQDYVDRVLKFMVKESKKPI